MKIVESGYKLDLHIHSIYSSGKDHGKVSYNTIEHIGELVNKINENGVQLCAITDHDAFGYDMYKALKEYENTGSIIKVFPGVEFSVEFQGDNGSKVVHVIAIFNDASEEKVKKISDVITVNNHPVYDRASAFSEEKFLAILREIDLDTILIAHQKNTLTSIKPKKADANSVGNEKFREFIYTDYFEAFEFKNRKNEIFNKSFIFNEKLEENIRFITGSDCHDWRVYPKEDFNDNGNFVYTYVKCLPSFRGLVMAITDHRRIKTVNSFFNPAAEYLPEISMTINGKENNIPLSRGINVIIGDNSIGKSLLLHKLTDYCKRKNSQIKKSLTDSYNKYLKKNKIDIITKITENQIFHFDMQGEVREKFEESKLKSDKILHNFYPEKVESDSYKEMIQRELQKIYYFLEEKFELDDLERELGSFKIFDIPETQAESLSFIGMDIIDNKASGEISNIINKIDLIIEKIKTLKNERGLENEDVFILNDILQKFSNMKGKYEEKKEKIDKENHKINTFMSTFTDFSQKYDRTVTDTHKYCLEYNTAIKRTKELLIELVLRRKNNQIPEVTLKKTKTDIHTNTVYKYNFNSKLCLSEFDESYVKKLFKDSFTKATTTSVFDMTKEDLTAALPYFSGSAEDALEKLKESIEKIIDDDFKNKYTITEDGTDKTQELSAGLNAKIYFDLLSYENSNNGIYLIDQPEDNISQKAIKDYLLDRFKTMGERRQVIIVTHNPQFIVNLDVDNVIYISKQNSEIKIQSGALEYKNDEYSILDIISTHIDGGLDTLRRRWKRYEKDNRI